MGAVLGSDVLPESSLHIFHALPLCQIGFNPVVLVVFLSWGAEGGWDTQVFSWMWGCSSLLIQGNCKAPCIESPTRNDGQGEETCQCSWGKLGIARSCPKQQRSEVMDPHHQVPWARPQLRSQQAPSLHWMRGSFWIKSPVHAMLTKKPPPKHCIQV